MDHGLVCAIIAALGGCSISYANKYKQGRHIKITYFIIDMFIAVFMAYFAFWYMIEASHLSDLDATLVCGILGNIGSRVLTNISDNFKTYLNNLGIFFNKPK